MTVRANDRKPCSFAQVATGLLVLTALAAAAAVFLYFRYIAYERRAVFHAAPSAREVAWLDVEKVLVYEPFRRHLLPLLDCARSSDGELLSRRLISYAALEVGVDLRELLVATGPGPSDWAIVAGGLFPTEHLLRRLATALEPLEPPWTFDAHAGRILGPAGAVLAQADDGALVLASGVGVLRQTLPRRQQALGSSPPAPGVWARALLRSAQASGSPRSPGERPRQQEGLGGHVPPGPAGTWFWDLAARPTLNLQAWWEGEGQGVRGAPPEPTSAASSLLFGPTDGPAPSVSVALTQSDRITGASGTRAVAQRPWSRAALDRSIARLAEALAHLGAGCTGRSLP